MSSKYNGPRNDMTCVSDLVYDLLGETLVTMSQAIKDVDVPVLKDGDKNPKIWDKLSILCQESKFLRESLTGVAIGLVADKESGLWRNHMRGVAIVLLSVMLNGTANARAASKTKRHHWLPCSLMSRFEDKSTLYVNPALPVTMVVGGITIQARIPFSEFVLEEGVAPEEWCYSDVTESTFSSLEYLFSQATKDGTSAASMSDFNKCALGAFSIAQEVRRPNENGEFSNGHHTSMLQAVLDHADAYGADLFIQPVGSPCLLSLNPFSSTRVHSSDSPDSMFDGTVSVVTPNTVVCLSARQTTLEDIAEVCNNLVFSEYEGSDSQNSGGGYSAGFMNARVSFGATR